MVGSVRIRFRVWGGVSLAELISSLICFDKFELLRLAFMGRFQTIIGSLFSELTDWGELLLNGQIFAGKQQLACIWIHIP